MISCARDKRCASRMQAQVERLLALHEALVALHLGRPGAPLPEAVPAPAASSRPLGAASLQQAAAGGPEAATRTPSPFARPAALAAPPDKPASPAAASGPTLFSSSSSPRVAAASGQPASPRPQQQQQPQRRQEEPVTWPGLLAAVNAPAPAPVPASSPRFRALQAWGQGLLLSCSLQLLRLPPPPSPAIPHRHPTQPHAAPPGAAPSPTPSNATAAFAPPAPSFANLLPPPPLPPQVGGRSPRRSRRGADTAQPLPELRPLTPEQCCRLLASSAALLHHDEALAGLPTLRRASAHLVAEAARQLAARCGEARRGALDSSGMAEPLTRALVAVCGGGARVLPSLRRHLSPDESGMEEPGRGGRSCGGALDANAARARAAAVLAEALQAHAGAFTLGALPTAWLLRLAALPAWQPALRGLPLWREVLVELCARAVPWPLDPASSQLPSASSSATSPRPPGTATALSSSVPPPPLQHSTGGEDLAAAAAGTSTSSTLSPHPPLAGTVGAGSAAASDATQSPSAPAAPPYPDGLGAAQLSGFLVGLADADAAVLSRALQLRHGRAAFAAPPPPPGSSPSPQGRRGVRQLTASEVVEAAGALQLGGVGTAPLLAVAHAAGDAAALGSAMIMGPFEPRSRDGAGAPALTALDGSSSSSNTGGGGRNEGVAQAEVPSGGGAAQHAQRALQARLGDVRRCLEAWDVVSPHELLRWSAQVLAVEGAAVPAASLLPAQPSIAAAARSTSTSTSGSSPLGAADGGNTTGEPGRGDCVGVGDSGGLPVTGAGWADAGLDARLVASLLHHRPHLSVADALRALRALWLAAAPPCGAGGMRERRWCGRVVADATVELAVGSRLGRTGDARPVLQAPLPWQECVSSLQVHGLRLPPSSPRTLPDGCCCSGEVRFILPS